MFRFCDSFDHYDTNFISQKWTTVIGGGAVITGSGRNNNGLLFQRSGIGIMPGVSLTLDPQSTWIVGFAFKNDAGTPGGTLTVIYDNAQQIGSVFIETDSTLSIEFGSNPAIGNRVNLGNISKINSGIWYYLEVKYVIGGGNLTATVRLNGHQIGNASQSISNYDPTQSYNPNTANRLVFTGCGPTATTIDDLYICDGQTGQNTFIGDVAISCIYPRQDVSTNFNPGGGNNYKQINEHDPDGDTTYVYDNVVGDQDTYLFDIVGAFSGTIPCVHLNVFCRKDDEGYRGLKSVGVAQNSINGNRYVNDSYNYQSFPDDITSWTPTSVNATAFGFAIVNVS